jgi:Domain of unknown function (DUF4386)
MESTRLRGGLLASACVAAPVFGIAAAIAVPGLQDSRSAELTAISQHSGQFFVYAICILVSSYLLVPAVFAIIRLVRTNRWSLVAGLLAQVGMLVAIGDAATELMYWQMGAYGADHRQMTALADRYENSAASLVYNIGGLAMLVGVVWLGALLWRSRALPRWAAAALPVGALANIAGFTIASQPVLVASYVVLAASLFSAAAAITSISRSGAVPIAEPAIA